MSTSDSTGVPQEELTPRHRIPNRKVRQLSKVCRGGKNLKEKGFAIFIFLLLKKTSVSSLIITFYISSIKLSRGTSSSKVSLCQAGYADIPHRLTDVPGTPCPEVPRHKGFFLSQISACEFKITHPSAPLPTQQLPWRKTMGQ